MANKRRLLVLGGGIYQVPLINRARELKLETIVVSPTGPYPGVALANQHWDLDTTNEDAILRASKNARIDAVVTTGTDVCLPALGRLVDELGLCGPSAASAKKSADKTLMKLAFREHGVPTADFEIVASLEDAQVAAQRVGFPVMVKASDSSGSRGVTKVEKAETLPQAWERSLGVSRNKKVIVEKCLEGIEFGAQAFVVGDKVQAVFAHNDTVTLPLYQTPIGHSLPLDFSKAQLETLQDIVERAVRALEIRDAVCNVDLMLVGDRMMVLEIGARMGATCLPENVSIYAGFDVYEYLIRLALGERPKIAGNRHQPNASFLLRSEITGTVRAIHIPDEVVKHPALVELRMDVQTGGKVKKFQVGPDRIGHVVVKGKEARGAERLAAELAERICVEVVA